MHCKCTARGKKPNWKMIIPKGAGGILHRSRKSGTNVGKRCTKCGTEVTVSETVRSKR